MDRLSFIFGLVGAACAGSHVFDSQDAGLWIAPRTVCVYDLTQGHELTVWTHAAMRDWGLFADGWSISTEPVCVGVDLAVLNHDAFARVRPSEASVGVSVLVSYGRDPVAAWFDSEWWEQCPKGRQALVYHEIGHVAGHRGHAPGVMRSSVDCAPEERTAVDALTRRRASLRRSRR